MYVSNCLFFFLCMSFVCLLARYYVQLFIALRERMLYLHI